MGFRENPSYFRYILVSRQALASGIPLVALPESSRVGDIRNFPSCQVPPAFEGGFAVQRPLVPKAASTTLAHQQRSCEKLL